MLSTHHNTEIPSSSWNKLQASDERYTQTFPAD